MLGIFNKSKSLSTRLAEFEQEQFLALAKAQKRTVADMLREAVIFYLDNYDQVNAELNQNRSESESKTKQAGRPNPKKETLLPSDYDDDRAEPRPNRWSWGA